MMALGVENSFIIDAGYIIRDINFTNDDFNADEIFDSSIVGLACFELFFGLEKPCQNCPVPRALQSKMSTESNIEFIPPNSPRQIRKAKAIPLSNGNNSQVVVDCLEKGVLATIGAPKNRENIYPKSNIKNQVEFKALDTKDRHIDVGKLIEKIAHKVNNNLAIILDQLDNDLPLTESSTRCENSGGPSQVIHEQVSKILEFFEDIQVPQPLEKDDLENTELECIVKNALQSVKNNFPNKNITIQLDIQKELPPYFCSEINIYQAFHNILKNAFESIDIDGIIKIKLIFDDSTRAFSLTIKDNGKGILQNDIKRVFDMFYTTKRKQGAFGIGLFFAKTIITNHGGTIHFGKIENSGTVVKLILPLEIPFFKNDVIKDG
jgi:two-component sensor histidine kinase